MSETRIRDFPPSAKLVYKALEYHGPQTQKQLVDETRLSSRTVRHALQHLEDAGVLESELHIPDARQKMYSLKRDADRNLPTNTE